MSVGLVGRVPVPADVGEHWVGGRIAGAVVVVCMDVYAVEHLQALGDTGEGHVDSRRSSVPAERNVPTSFPSTSWSVAVADHESDGVEAFAADAVTKVRATAHVAVASR